MKEFWTLTRVCFSAIGGWLDYFLGGCDNLMIALIVFAVADYVTGVMCAIIDKKLSSEVGFKGIFKKVLIFILVGIAHMAAALLKQYGLGIERLFTHTHWLNVKDGKAGTVDDLNTMRNAYKMCPLYILPHWAVLRQKWRIISMRDRFIVCVQHGTM